MLLDDWVFDYNEEPGYMRDLLLHNLTCEALNRLETTSLSKREIIRRLGTSPAQFYRLIDTTNYRKSVDKMLSLLQVLGCEVDVTVPGEEKRVGLCRAAHSRSVRLSRPGDARPGDARRASALGRPRFSNFLRSSVLRMCLRTRTILGVTSTSSSSGDPTRAPIPA